VTHAIIVILACLGIAQTTQEQALPAHFAYLDSVLTRNLTEIAAGRRSAAQMKQEFTEIEAKYKAWAEKDRRLIPVRRLAYAFSLDAEREGDSLAHSLSGTCSTSLDAKAYIIQAIDSGRLDPMRMLAYGRALKATDGDRYASVLRDLIARFPSSPAAMHALAGLAEDAASTAEKRSLLERIQTDFASLARHQRSDLTVANRRQPAAVYNRVMRDLFGIYLMNGDEAKATALADQMAAANPDDDAWAATRYIQAGIAKAKEYGPDVILSDPRVIDQARAQLLLWQARRATYQRVLTTKAYDAIVRMAAEAPADVWNAEARALGAKLQKTDRQVDEDIWRVQTSDLDPFTPFDLSTYDSRTLKLSELRGKVVLVSFWFPTCQGCVEEMPNFQHIVEKYAKTGKFAIVAINVVPDQDDAVLPMFARMHYTFTPLKAPSQTWQMETYGVGGAPWNYLLDGSGRPIYAGFTAASPAEREALERRIDWVMAHLLDISKAKHRDE
jgi:thiol-disulfide isomerase/thioredoxin